MNRLKNMSLEKKLISGILLVFLLVVGAAMIFDFTFSSNDVKTFYGADLVDTKIDNLAISDVDISEEDGIITYEATVTAEINKKVSYIKITIKDKDDKEIVTLIGYVGATLKKGEARKIVASTDADLKKIKSIVYEVVE